MHIVFAAKTIGRERGGQIVYRTIAGFQLHAIAVKQGNDAIDPRKNGKRTGLMYLRDAYAP